NINYAAKTRRLLQESNSRGITGCNSVRRCNRTLRYSPNITIKSSIELLKLVEALPAESEVF
ncbi:hypothetical protein, partial [Gracilibacillus halotolerans]|uniref:hypothetical protein n=1 Tax=Gracilibacillus halotolerans TaxID=74386 RepID=UPI0031DEE3C7